VFEGGADLRRHLIRGFHLSDVMVGIVWQGMD
jgi:hypothetical protein